MFHDALEMPIMRADTASEAITNRLEEILIEIMALPWHALVKLFYCSTASAPLKTPTPQNESSK